MNSDIRAAGFTLVEVMVALAVVSLGLISVFNAIIQISDQSTHIRERSFAHWVAMNELARLRISGSFPEVSEFDGDVEFAGTDYRWRATVSETGVEDLRRVDMRVSYADLPDDVIATTTGFLSPRPPPAPGGSAAWSDAGPSGSGRPGDGDDSGNGDDSGDGGNDG